MARLKQVAQTRWIGDLPSHAAQHVVKDLIKALQAMLRERQKAVAEGRASRVGFPRFKKAHYAEGSVYLANTQLTFDLAHNRVRFPGGIGWVKFRGSDIAKGDKLMGARLWRQGEDWYLSPQFEMPSPAALPLTGRNIGVKVAAGTLATVYDGAHLRPARDAGRE
jgi:transposase